MVLRTRKYIQKEYGTGIKIAGKPLVFRDPHVQKVDYSGAVSPEFQQLYDKVVEKIGELTLIMSSGSIITVAAVVNGPKASEFRDQVEAAIKEIEDEHGEILEEWEGDMSSTKPIDEQMRKLVLGEYVIIKKKKKGKGRKKGKKKKDDE